MLQENQYNNHGKFGEFNCIWMASNTIDYQVCVKDFDCDNCTLDKILRNISRQNNTKNPVGPVVNEIDFLDKIINKLEEIKLDTKIIYLKNNLVLKHLFANIYYLGINPVTLGLLDSISSVKEFMRKVYFNTDQKIITLEGEWGQLTFKVPMSFLLLDKLNWTPEDIINRQWLALIVINQSEIIDSQISAEDWKVERARVLKTLNEYKELCSKINPSFLATSQQRKYIYQLTGKAEYLKLLNSVQND